MSHTDFDSVDLLLNEIVDRKSKGHNLVTFAVQQPPALGFKDKTDGDSTFTVSIEILDAHYGGLGPVGFLADFTGATRKGAEAQKAS